MPARKPVVVTLAVLALLTGPASAWDPPAGGDSIPFLDSPLFLSGSMSAAETGTAMADVLNPAASGSLQRTRFDANLAVLTAFGPEFGGTLTAGLALPMPYGVWTMAAGGLYEGFDSELEWGGYGWLRGGMAKDVFADLRMGAALELTLGGDGTFGWGATVDLGVQGDVGDLWFMKNFTWGAALRNVGIQFPGLPRHTGTGFAGSTLTSWDSPFTPALGMSADLLRSPAGISIGLDMDLWFPTFQNVAFSTGLQFGFKDMAFLRLGWGFNLRETLTSSAGVSWLPGFGLSASFPTGGKSAPKAVEPTDAAAEAEATPSGEAVVAALDEAAAAAAESSTEAGATPAELAAEPAPNEAANARRGADVAPAIGARPFNNGVWAIGAGTTVTLGRDDTEAPVVALGYPASSFDLYYMSPNGDGVQDALAVPITVTDERYVLSWNFVVKAADGTVVRSWSAAEVRPAPGSFASLMAGLAYVKKSVEVPASITWDGRDTAGTVVPDGRYSYSMEAVDDNGNLGASDVFDIVVDSTPPTANASGPSPSIFSPDGDGNKDSYAIEQGGSVEDLWVAEVLDAAGAVVKRWEFKDGQPAALTWDGKADQGGTAPEGNYAYRVSAVDRAGNKGSASIDSIVVNTQQPPVGVNADGVAFSPNGDGSRDTLDLVVSVPVRTGLTTWTLLVADSAGKTRWSVSGTGASTLLTRYAYEGRDVAGNALPDGSYRARVTAFYENGHSPSAWSLPFVIDTAPPTVKASGPVRDNALIFSPDGDGNKDDFPIAQTGSVEERWTAVVSDETGRPIRTWEFTGAAPKDVTWDGKDDAGKVVPDGRYDYRVSASDKAGNAGVARIENIIVNTLQPTVAVSIDINAFSPNADGIKDVVTLTVDVPVRAGLNQWKLAVVDASGAERWTATGTDPAALQKTYVLDGRGSDGRPLPEGTYRVRLSAAYANGHRPEASSPEYLIDLTPPSATATVDRTAFNPLGAAATTVSIAQTGSAEERWTGQVLDAAGKAVKTWDFIGTPDPVVAWDGSDDAGKVVADGLYGYRLTSTDRGGNSVTVRTAMVAVDTEAKAVRLSLDRRAFSPNGDGSSDTVGIIPEVQSAGGVRSWTVSVVDAAGAAVRSYTGSGSAPDGIVWDGKIDAGAVAPDGLYHAQVEIKYVTDEVEAARSVDLILDTIAPVIRLAADLLLFSPNGDGLKDAVRFAQDSDPGDNWEGVVTNAAGKTVRAWTWKDRAAPFEWNGTDSEGNRVPDGAYRYLVSSEDAAGNRVERRVEGITVDNRATQVFATATASGFSPNGDGLYDELAVNLIVNLRDGVDAWKLVVADSSGAARRTWSGKGSATIPASQKWDGKDDAGKPLQGEFAAVFTVTYQKGDRPEARTKTFTVDSMGPATAVRFSSEFFSPDGDGVDDELRITLATDEPSGVDSWKLEIVEVAVTESAGERKERPFFTWTGRGRPPERLVWDGRSQRGELVESATDYPWRVTLTDVWGNVTVLEGLVKVDVLVIREGDRLKIKVPSIVFRSDFADFDGLTQETIDRNAQVLQRIAQILNRFQGYRIRIEGHANSVAKIIGAGRAAIEREETTELIPLSTARAEAVRLKLIEYGVAPARLSVRGLGSSEPVVDFKDAENRWKNRRVEFILIKE